MRIDGVTFRTSILAITLVAASACGPRRDGGAPRVPVSVARVERRALPYELQATGTVEAIRSVDVIPQVNGTILRVRFGEGDEVAAGQVLFEIDPRPYQAALQQAEGTLLRDLTQAQSAAREASRYKTLAATNTVTQEDYESKQSAADAAYAAVRSDSATAAIARLNLDYATVRAPIGGRTGRLLLHEGNLVRAGGLWPGEFVAITLILGMQNDAVVVPSQAVMQGQQGTYVFVVNNDGTAMTQPVTVERTLDSLTVVAGVPAGSLVVTDGQLRLTPNAKVDIRGGPTTETAGGGGGGGSDSGHPK